MDRIRNQIDEALQQDDAHRRRFLLLPTRFLRPESMGQGDITVWTNFIREETEVVINQLEEDLVVRGDPDDPFNGAANGVFQQLQNNLPLPPPVRMPRRQEDIGELSEHSQKSPKDTEKSKQEDVKMKETLNTWRMQGVRCESSKHLLVSPDPMRSIQNLHTGDYTTSRTTRGSTKCNRETRKTKKTKKFPKKESKQ